MGSNTINLTSIGNGVPAGKLSDGLTWDPATLYGAPYNPGLLVNRGAAVQSSPNVVDPNGGRPPRVNQWNISLQRQITKDLAVETAYVGNRGSWFQANGLISYNAVNPAKLKALGIDITNATDRQLLTSSITSPLATPRGLKKPDANFPDSGPFIQS